MRRTFFNRPIIILLATVAGVIVLGTIGFTILEGLTLFQAFYFTVVTVATVGFGDIYPVTNPGKILAIVVIFAGVGSFTAFLYNVTRLLVERRQQQGRNEQTNILIGLFFSAIGDRLLLHFFLADPNHSEIGTDILKPDQTEKDYLSLRERFRHHSWELDRGKIDLNYLKGLLTGKQDMLTRMLESPNLLEREQPTELLRATFHMMEELSARPRLDDLPNSDVVHLLFDSARVYRLAAGQWLERVQYLKINYPYLFSLVLRTNPFNENRSPIVK